MSGLARRIPLRVAVFGLLATAAHAQRSNQPTDLDVRLAELRRHEGELRDIVTRHERGEDVSKTRWLELRAPGQVDPEIASRSLASSEADARVLREELARVLALREAGRRENEARATGDTKPRSEEIGRVPRPEPKAPTAVVTPSSLRAPLGVDGSVPPGETRIQGSLDHRRVGHAHLNAGIELRRESARLAAEGRVAAAAAADDAAQKRLQAAREELALVANTGSAELADLFGLARCEESLGEHEHADTLYTEVMARDLRRRRDGTVDYGVFGRAASTARGVLGWLRESGDWRPRRNVDDIVLPNR